MNIYKILEALKGVEEGTMAGAEKHATGPAFTGYWKGKDSKTPGTKMVGGAAESVETECDQPMTLADKLRARWEETKRQKGLQEVGMTTGGMAGMTGGAANPTAGGTEKPDPQEVAKVQQAVNKLSGPLKKAGVPIPSVSQAVQSVMKDPVKDPATALDKKIDAGLGQAIGNIIDKGDPNSINQLASILQKNTQQG